MNLRKKIRAIVEGFFESDNSIKSYEKMMINAVIEFLKEEWGFDAKIIVKKKDNDKYIGDISLNDNSVNNHKFTLHFNPNQSYVGMIRSLIHELTHVKQVVKGELKPKQDYKSIIWKHDFELPVREYNKIAKDFGKYSNLPWELEADKNMNDKSLREKLYKSKHWQDLRGKDATLDFILDNL